MLPVRDRTTRFADRRLAAEAGLQWLRTLARHQPAGEEVGRHEHARRERQDRETRLERGVSQNALQVQRREELQSERRGVLQERGAFAGAILTLGIPRRFRIARHAAVTLTIVSAASAFGIGGWALWLSSP